MRDFTHYYHHHVLSSHEKTHQIQTKVCTEESHAIYEFNCNLFDTHVIS